MARKALRTKRSRKPHRRNTRGLDELLFPTMRRGHSYGVGVAIALARAAGPMVEFRLVRRSVFERKPAGRPTERLVRNLSARRLSSLVAGLAHPRRLQILLGVLTGANTHQALRTLTRLLPGPLYHHLRALERVGMVRFVERNRYEVSTIGRDVLLTLAVLLQEKPRSIR